MVKAAFIPKLDALLYFDYEQIELRLLAYYMATLGDTSMADAIWDGKDLHTESAAAALRLPGELTDEQRQVGKTLNFSMVYGGGRPTLMRQLGISFQEATGLLHNFHARWPGIDIVQEAIRDQILMRAFGWDSATARNNWYEAARRRAARELWDTALEHGGYITTLWGRHLHPESEHKALNALVQGCAADLMRAALVKVHQHLGSRLMASHLVNQVHDELQIDAIKAEIPYLVEMVPVLMDHPPVSAVVPIGTDCEISFTTWADKQPYMKEEDGRLREPRELVRS